MIFDLILLYILLYFVLSFLSLSFLSYFLSHVTNYWITCISNVLGQIRILIQRDGLRQSVESFLKEKMVKWFIFLWVGFQGGAHSGHILRHNMTKTNRKQSHCQFIWKDARWCCAPSLDAADPAHRSVDLAHPCGFFAVTSRINS